MPSCWQLCADLFALSAGALPGEHTLCIQLRLPNRDAHLRQLRHMQGILPVVRAAGPSTPAHSGCRSLSGWNQQRVIVAEPIRLLRFRCTSIRQRHLSLSIPQKLCDVGGTCSTSCLCPPDTPICNGGKCKATCTSGASCTSCYCDPITSSCDNGICKLRLVGGVLVAVA